MNNLEIYLIEILNEFVLIQVYHHDNNHVDIVDIQLILHENINRLILKHYLD